MEKERKIEAPDGCEIEKAEIVDGAAVITFKEIERKLPNRATDEAVLALCQLMQLRNCYNGDWVPDWKNGRETKFMIIIYEGEIDVDCSNSLPSSLLYFKSKELRDEFLLNFRPLIEKLKPLYGIKEGGEA